MEDLTEKSRRDRSGTGGRRGTRRDSRDGDEMQQEGGGHVFRSRDGGPMRGNPNNDEQGGRGESSQVGERKRSGGTWDRGGRTRSVDLEDFVEVKRSGRSRDYRETGDGRQGVVWEEAASRCVATYGWIAEEGAGVARGINIFASQWHFIGFHAVSSKERRRVKNGVITTQIHLEQHNCRLITGAVDKSSRTIVWSPIVADWERRSDRHGWILQPGSVVTKCGRRVGDPVRPKDDLSIPGYI
ncbi:hypothetical protein BJ322DRAFT_1017700 [Thelephora terrestris]|uniref:Uncharacterized protein n=1 Tax=Thelephora terrestris TaxID=56493 RepID=A0A9P6HNK9_9AGAM|nr:hypothetical protein BJ322DRAFT_1017700 [Thelephora terrestris]